MQSNLPAVLGALVGDVFSAENWGLANLAGVGIEIAASQLIRRRTEQARDILIDELKRGNTAVASVDPDETVAILLRYGRAAQEGAARLNLRLMAQVIAGQANQGALYADDFLRYAETLAGLRREEVVLLGALQRHWHSSDLQVLSTHDRMNEARRRMVEELVPVPFPDQMELIAAEAATVRTGFIASTATYGGVIYQPTRTFMRLCDLAFLETALAAEPI